LRRWPGPRYMRGASRKPPLQAVSPVGYRQTPVDGSPMAFVIELSPPPHPLAACKSLRGLPDLLLLDSARGGRHCYLAADPWEVVRDPQRLRERLSREAHPARPDLPPFQGGAAGWIDYEWNSPAAGGDAFRFGLYD